MNYGLRFHRKKDSHKKEIRTIVKFTVRNAIDQSKRRKRRFYPQTLLRLQKKKEENNRFLRNLRNKQ